jgi:hypothetical protein
MSIVGIPGPVAITVSPQAVNSSPSTSSNTSSVMSSSVSYEQLFVGPLLTGGSVVGALALMGEKYKAPASGGWFSGLFGVSVVASFAGQVTSQWILPALGIVPGSALSLSSGALIQIGVVALGSIVFLKYMNKSLYSALGPVMIGVVSGGAEILSQWLNTNFVQGIFSSY